jgi:heme-degrading monooxygenase HmoA
MVIVVFRTRLRPGLTERDFAELAELGARMQRLAAAMPGYVSSKDFEASDGEALSIVEFSSEETLRAWRNHPEHRQAQQAGRERFFAAYQIQVCTPLRSYRFPDRGS